MFTLEERAEICASQAKEALVNATSVQMFREYTEPLANGLLLSLRTRAHIGYHPFTNETASTERWVYIQQDTESQVRFSFGLSQLIRDGTVVGLRPEHVVRALVWESLTKSPSTREMLHFIHKAVMGIIHPAELKELERLFMLASELGKTSTYSYRRVELGDESKLDIECYESEDGEIDHLRPPLKVMVQEKDSDTHTVLEKTYAGEYESFVEVADTVVREAGYHDEEDITRFPDGRIFAVHIRLDKIQAVEEAERIMGLRRLDDTRLKVIEKALSDAALLD